jgi:hypothetical protein
MQRRTCFKLLLVLVMADVVFSASTRPSGQEHDWQSGESCRGYVVSIAMDQRSYIAGEPVPILIQLKREAASAAQVLADYKIAVTDKNGGKVPPTAFAPRANGLPVRPNIVDLAVGSRATKEIRLSRLVDLSIADDYIVQVSATVGGATGNPKDWSVASSATIKFSIREPPFTYPIIEAGPQDDARPAAGAGVSSTSPSP